MQYKIKVHSIWEFGKRKDSEGNPHQEDSLFPCPNELNDNDRVFILCDGMGGHDQGEVASATVCETMGATVLKAVKDPSGAFPDVILQEALTNALKALDEKDSGAQKKMGTTMTFLKFHSAGYTAAHIGDSRIYQFRPGPDASSTKILFKSEDHSLVNDLIKIGELTEEEAKTFPQRNVITRAMQPHDERLPKADIHHSSDIRKGDYFYMCSDGMLEQATDENLKLFFSNDPAMDTIEKKVNALTLATQENSDNHTAFVIEILEVSGAPTPLPECSPKECPLLIIKDNVKEENPGLQPIISPAGIPGNIEASVNPISKASAGNPEIRVKGAGIGKKRSNSKSSVLVYILGGLLVVLVLLVAYFLFFSGKKSASTTEIRDAEESEIVSPRYDKREVAEEPSPAGPAVPASVRTTKKVQQIVKETKVSVPVKNNTKPSNKKNDNQSLKPGAEQSPSPASPSPQNGNSIINE